MMNSICRVIAGTLTTLALCLPSSLAPAQDDQSAADVIASYIKAIGGEQAISKTNSAFTKANLIFAGSDAEASLELFQKNGKFYFEVNADLLGTIRRGFDGKTCWEIHPNSGARVIEGKMRHAYVSTYGKPIPAVAWTEQANKGLVKMKGIQEVNGTKCYKLEFAADKAYPATRYFDVETEYLRRNESVREFGDEGEMQITVDFSDYQQHHGVNFSMTREYEIVGANAYSVQYTVVDFAAEIDDDKFELPEVIRDLLEND